MFRVTGAMNRKTLFLAAAVASLFAVSCASGRKDPTLGTRTLDCVVAEREHDSPGSSGASYQGTGLYYIVFEAREGQATSRYRLEVTRQQFYRYPEGSHVRITLNNNILVDIRPNE